jgi:hypothetical protein
MHKSEEYRTQAVIFFFTNVEKKKIRPLKFEERLLYGTII